MTKAAALAMINAMEGAKLPGTLALTFPGGAATYGVQFDFTHVYTGADLLNIANYCATNNLTLTATFSQFGVT